MKIDIPVDLWFQKALLHHAEAMFLREHPDNSVHGSYVDCGYIHVSGVLAYEMWAVHEVLVDFVANGGDHEDRP